MRFRAIGAAVLLLAADVVVAMGQIPGGGGAVVAGSTPVIGCASPLDVLFNNTGVIGCDNSFKYAGSGGTLQVPTFMVFGGTTASFPALKQSGAGLLARTADDSANATFDASIVHASAWFSSGAAGNLQFYSNDSASFGMVLTGANSNLLVQSPTASSSLATGAIQVTGGAAINGNLNVGGTVNQFGSTATAPAHIATAQTTAPVLTSCGGGSPAIVGTDTAGIVTMGTTASGCIITFNTAYTAAPFCVVSWIATPLATQSYVTTNSAVTLTQAPTSGNVVQYHCIGRAGG